MASLTITFDQLSPSDTPSVHTGIIAKAARISRTAAYSASSVFNMTRVPHGATLLDFVLRINLASANQTWEMGTSNTPSGILALSTLTSTFSLSVGTGEEVNFVRSVIRGYETPGYGLVAADAGMFLPAHVSLSDDVQPANIWIQGRPTSAGSASAIFQFVLFYTMDGTQGHTNIR